MLELSPPLPILLLLHIEGLSRLNTTSVDGEHSRVVSIMVEVASHIIGS
jgi:hypothetical protein